MSLPWHVHLVNCLLVVGAAMALEVCFVAFADLPEAPDWKLKGHTYVWMVPIYALIYPAGLWLFPLLERLPWAARGLVYMALIYAVEYSSGWLLRRATGHCPWESGYHKARWGVQGLIRLDFAPVWFAASLAYEALVRFLLARA